MSLRERVDALIARVEKREFLEAMSEFYAQDASVQENLGPPRSGLDAIMEHERKTLAVMKFASASAVSSIVEGDRAAIHWVFDIRTPDGRSIHLDEIAYQAWRSDKIVSERYVYDPSQMVPK
jgi:hypothetical protein